MYVGREREREREREGERKREREREKQVGQGNSGGGGGGGGGGVGGEGGNVTEVVHSLVHITTRYIYILTSCSFNTTLFILDTV